MNIIDPSCDPRWDDFVAHHPDGTVFHTSNWARVLQKSYGFEPFYLIGENRHGQITAGMPFFLVGNRLTGRRLVSLPFTDRCAPLASGPEDIKMLAAGLSGALKTAGAGNIEIRSGTTFPDFCVHSYYKLFLLDLDKGVDGLWAGLKPKSVRYPIKKAEACGMTVRQAVDRDDMRTFHRLNMITRQKHGVFPQPCRFFDRIYDELIRKHLAFLLIAEYHRKAIAASMFFTYRDMTYYKYNCSDRSYAGFQPNHLLLWQAIKMSCQAGSKVMDFGRTSPDNHGLASFKRHWGTREEDLPYWYYPALSAAGGTIEKSRFYRLASSVLKKTPVFLLERLGAVGYKYFA